jgi:hypothetical protein
MSQFCLPFEMIKLFFFSADLTDCDIFEYFVKVNHLIYVLLTASFIDSTFEELLILHMNHILAKFIENYLFYFILLLFTIHLS